MNAVSGIRFGPHGRETADQIIQRKRREIEHNGWTLWSFQYRRAELLEEWSRLLSAAGKPVVFCTNSPSARDPAETGAPVEAKHCCGYRLAGHMQWQPLPEGVIVPHPFKRGRKQASAFVVEGIVHPLEAFVLSKVQWLKDGQWLETRVPTRGEYLIRRGGSSIMRSVRALLVLRPPFLATVTCEERT